MEPSREAQRGKAAIQNSRFQTQDLYREQFPSTFFARREEIHR
jgi:hypothetical protein